MGFGDLENKYVVANILTVWSLPAVVIVGAALSLAHQRVRRLGDGMVLGGGVGTFLDGVGVAIFSYASYSDPYNYKGEFRVGVGAWVGLAGGLLCAVAGVLLLISISSVRTCPFEGSPGEAEDNRD